MTKREIDPIPITISDLFIYYPETKALRNTTIKEWNEVRDDLKDKVPQFIINFIDASGLVKQRFNLNYL
ncbi:hypothetical protein LCGC14_2337790 [marine sediment metagenome]|uniref:Uncharacterized protein n=1 Tax=marine sediment metagenome TaxID=412755 RepID=A0A0F9CDR5_9ZZZZ